MGHSIEDQVASAVGFKADPLAWARCPRSQVAMDWLCHAIQEGREAHRLLPILQAHVRSGHPFAGELARKVANLDTRAAA